MAEFKRTRSRARKKAFRRVLQFPQARARRLPLWNWTFLPPYYYIEIKFQDKIALVFDLEPCVMVYPEFTDWKTGNYKPLKRWRPIHSRSSRL